MNIAVLLDGTWSDANTYTNIAQIAARVPRRVGEAAQETCYIKGVGTGPFDRLQGGMLGAGLDDDIREAYSFVAAHRQSDDDQIHLIGYSRGAFAARSLAGMIAKCGILREAELPAAAVFARYRDTNAPDLREMRAGEKPARTAEDELVLARSRLVRIRFIGVFDTVGSLGIPGGLGRLVNRRRYEFHDTRLSGLVDLACHAIAIDEDRKQFVPTLWTSVPIPIPQHPTRVEQRWFTGDHSNVGGGGTNTPAIDNPLSVLTSEWIVDRRSRPVSWSSRHRSPRRGMSGRGGSPTSMAASSAASPGWCPGSSPTYAGADDDRRDSERFGHPSLEGPHTAVSPAQSIPRAVDSGAALTEWRRPAPRLSKVAGSSSPGVPPVATSCSSATVPAHLLRMTTPLIGAHSVSPRWHCRGDRAEDDGGG